MNAAGVQYIGTSATQVIGADSPDSAGKIYYRLTIEDTELDGFLGGIGFDGSLAKVYTALASSNIVIPISPAPHADGSGVAVIDLVNHPSGKSNSVGDVIELADSASAFAQTRSIERIRLQNVSSSTAATSRQAASTAAATTKAAEDKASAISTKAGDLFSSVVSPLKWIAIGLVVLVLLYLAWKADLFRAKALA